MSWQQRMAWKFAPQNVAGNRTAAAISSAIAFARSGSSEPEPIVLSSTSCPASVYVGRRFVGIEKDPAYFAVAAERLSLVQSSGTTSDSTQGQHPLMISS